MPLTRAFADLTPLRTSPPFRRLWVDRVDRRKFALVTTAGQAACSVLLAVQGFLADVPVLAVLGLVAAQSCFVAGGGPAARAPSSRGSCRRNSCPPGSR
ncbi:hypothetical protein [Amycolatopsis sp. CA-128772]|uniref:hypothetical protein n=1 Tax=Amycolatopsis sp. CA-128772 TaxID=2073159 RepID=UPI001E439C18|nr:hypothetical protein [Amycolatopsis sp. CA-128772]